MPPSLNLKREPLAPQMLSASRVVDLNLIPQLEDMSSKASSVAEALFSNALVLGTDENNAHLPVCKQSVLPVALQTLYWVVKQTKFHINSVTVQVPNLLASTLLANIQDKNVSQILPNAMQAFKRIGSTGYFPYGYYARNEKGACFARAVTKLLKPYEDELAFLSNVMNQNSPADNPTASSVDKTHFWRAYLPPFFSDNHLCLNATTSVLWCCSQSTLDILQQIFPLPPKDIKCVGLEEKIGHAVSFALKKRKVVEHIVNGEIPYFTLDNFWKKDADVAIMALRHEHMAFDTLFKYIIDLFKPHDSLSDVSQYAEFITSAFKEIGSPFTLRREAQREHCYAWAYQASRVTVATWIISLLLL